VRGAGGVEPVGLEAVSQPPAWVAWLGCKPCFPLANTTVASNQCHPIGSETVSWSGGEEVVGLDDFFAEVGEGHAAGLAFELEAAVGVGFGEVETFHEDALGAFDELAGFELVRERGVLFAEGLVVAGAGDGDFDLCGEGFGDDGFDEVGEYAGGGGAADQVGVGVGGDHDDGCGADGGELCGEVEAVVVGWGGVESDVEEDEVGGV
jgi:hypothetical protein